MPVCYYEMIIKKSLTVTTYDVKQVFCFTQTGFGFWFLVNYLTNFIFSRFLTEPQTYFMNRFKI
jgi:hypothetical protein